MANETIQFNAMIPDDLAKRVKQEAVEHGVTLGEITAQALAKFLCLPVAQRRLILSRKKILGRKITA